MGSTVPGVAHPLHGLGWDPWLVGEVGAETLVEMWLQSQEVLSGKGAVGKNSCLWLL